MVYYNCNWLITSFIFVPEHKLSADRVVIFAISSVCVIYVISLYQKNAKITTLNFSCIDFLI